ncbi:MAG: serine/threonine protein kinase [Gemmataceae bacterium]|nr:serine/threonine protein kinase [Gemmataceae bacterium]
MSAPAQPESGDEAAFAVLHTYLEMLQAGGQPPKEQLLAEHPELAGALEALEALENLAPVPATGPNSAATVGFTDSPAADVARPPTAFGKYQLQEELGRGGMGIVYKAWQLDLARPVALKMILAGCLASPEHVQRFHDEAKAAAGLHHSNIVAIYEAGHLHGQPYFAMQYIGGPSLAARLAEGPLQPDQAARCVEAVARAVGHLHTKGFVHRDLKPSNILLDEDGRPYVTDFGLVKMLQVDSHKTATGAILGTPSYMAPEQAAGKVREVGPRSDVYSRGAILYEALTGQPPFREETPLDTLVQVLEGEPVRPSRRRPGIPRDLETVCLKCLEKAPEDRYLSAEALADDLRRFLDGEEIEARRAGPVSLLRRWARREPALASRVMVLAACCVIIQTNFSLGGAVDLGLHLKVMGVFTLWGAASVAFQCLLNRKEGLGWIPFAWSAADVGLLTSQLLLYRQAEPVHGVETPFLIGFPVLVATSGLWFRVPLVWFTAALSLLGHAALLLEHARTVGAIHAPHQHVIFVVGVITVGFVVAYQVKRVRALSRYYEHRPLP